MERDDQQCARNRSGSKPGASSATKNQTRAEKIQGENIKHKICNYLPDAPCISAKALNKYKCSRRITMRDVAI